MSDTDAVEVVDAELVDDNEHTAGLPAVHQPLEGRPLITRHTMLAPGDPIPTTATAPRYSEADFRISQKTKERVQGSGSENTSRTYGSARGQFEAWCRGQGRVHLPCTTATFVEYVSHLIDRDVAPGTINVAMSAIRTWHEDGQQPGTKQAREMLRAHARNWARRKSPKQAPAIRTPMLEAMVGTCTWTDDRERPKALRDAALLTLGWGMLSRRSELAHLLIENLTVEDDGVTVKVAFSKTDQEAHGESTFVPADPDSPAVCPVRCVRAWLEELRSHGITSGALFRQITRGGNIPVRRTERGDFLSPDAVGAIVKGRAALAGVSDPSRPVTGHGLRRGPAQEIAEAHGDPTSQGRWAAGSATVRKHYVKPAQDKAKNPLRAARAKAREQADN
ncbi:site-specific integrase [Streptomyces griseoluteus]|uniref:site-specific integrase n=1 Tax=Streptomyces griseoluteus TaxID=29306 RepID=UPI0033237C92